MRELLKGRGTHPDCVTRVDELLPNPACILTAADKGVTGSASSEKKTIG